MTIKVSKLNQEQDFFLQSHEGILNVLQKASAKLKRYRRYDDDRLVASNKKLKLEQKVDQATYSASGLKHTLHGDIYQLKLLMLFLKRGVDEGYSFRLATEMDMAEKFDDLVFQYDRNKADGTGKEKVWKFLQAKHKQDKSRKIGIGDLLTEEKNGDFSLGKYFDSYLKIRQNNFFDEVVLEDFIIATNIGFDFESPTQNQVIMTLKKVSRGKNVGKEISVKKIEVDDEFLNIQGSTRYKFNNLDPNNGVILHLKQSKDVRDSTRVNEFLNKLVFALDLPNEVELEGVIKDSMEKDLIRKFNCFGESRRAYDSFQKELLDWMKKKKGHFLSSEEGKDFLRNAEQLASTFHRMEVSLKNIETQQISQGNTLEEIKERLYKIEDKASVDRVQVQEELKQPIHYAAENGNKEVVNDLLKEDPNLVYLPTNLGNTPLHLAAKNGHDYVVNILLNHAQEKDPNKFNDFIDAHNYQGGKTALTVAIINGNNNVYYILKDKGANIRVESTNPGNTPLHYAAKAGNLEIVNDLLSSVKKEGIDKLNEFVNVKDKDNWTPSHLAAQNGHKDIVEALLENRADINAKSTSGYTPLHVAVAEGHKEVVTALLDKGANVNIASNENVTPLHLAAQNGYKDVVMVLLDKGADVNIASNDGITPLHLAVQNGHLDIVKYFKELLERDLSVLEKYYSPEHFEAVRALNVCMLNNLANAYDALGDPQKQKELLERALEIQESHYGPDHFEMAKTLVNLGNAYGALGNYRMKSELLEKALPILKENYGPDYLVVTKTLKNLSNTYEVLGDTQKQSELLEQVRISSRLNRFLSLVSSKELFKDEYRKLYSQEGEAIFYDEGKRKYYYTDHNQRVYMNSKDINFREIKDLYLNVLSRMKDSIVRGDINRFKDFSKIIIYINQIEKNNKVKNDQGGVIFLPKIFYNDNSNSIKDTNLIILACKYNQPEVLNYLFDDQTKILSSLSTDIGIPAIQPSDIDGENHNAFYYAIRSDNVDLLYTLINKWPGNYFSTPDNLQKLDNLLSKAYEELKLKNVPLSEKMEVFVENKLINLRFFHEKSGSSNTKPSLNDVKERINMVIKNVELLIKEYSDAEKKVDEKFLFASRFIAQNLYVLKRLLKSTYNELPWEEMEFCLVGFVSAHVKDQEINFIYNSVLNKQRLLSHLDNFKKKLDEVKSKIKDENVGSELPQGLERSELLKELKHNDILFEIYSDYEQIKDVYSLERIKYYIRLALSDNVEEDLRQLAMERALQVTGEYLKNTLESPHLSDDVSNVLLATFQEKNTKEIITRLRDRLSHAIITLPNRDKEYLLGKRVNSQLSTPGLEDDFKKLDIAIDGVLYDKKIRILRAILKKISDSKGLNEVKGFTQILDNVQLKGIKLDSVNTKEFDKTKELIEKLKNKIKDQTDYEKWLFARIEEIIKSEGNKSLDIKTHYAYGLSGLESLIDCVNNDYGIGYIKTLAGGILYDIMPNDIMLRTQRKSFEEIVSMVLKIHSSVEPRLQPNHLNEIESLVYNIFYNSELNAGRIGSIKEFNKKLEVKAEQTHVQDEMNNILTNIKQRLSDQEYGSLKLEEKIKICEEKHKARSELKDLLNKLKSLSDLKDKLLSEFYDLVQKTGYVRKLTDKDLTKLKNFITREKDYYDDLKKSINIFIKNGEFDKVSESIEELFKNLTPDQDLQDKLVKALKSILCEKKAEYEKHFDERLNKLKKLYSDLNEPNKLNLIQNYKNNKEQKAAQEMLVLDITAFLEEKAKRLDTSIHVTASFLDKYSPLLIGKQLRNYLAHGNALVDILQPDPSIAVISNALKFVEEGSGLAQQDNRLIGQPILDLQYLNDHHKNNLELIVNQQKMFTAAEQGTLEEVKSYIREGADINARDINEWNILHYAARGDSLEVIKFLLDQELNINVEDVKGQKLLHIAASFNGIGVVRFFIEDKGVNVNYFDNQEQTLLHYAAIGGCKEVVGFLLDHEADINVKTKEQHETPLHLAAQYGHKDIVDLLLGKGAVVGYTTNEDRTALHLAAQKGHEGVVKTLIEYVEKNDPTRLSAFVKDKYDATPLHYAAENGNLEVVGYLVDKRADVNAEAKNNRTPLHSAAQHGREKVVEILIQNGARINVEDGIKKTPLHYAAGDGYEDVVNALLNTKGVENIDVNAKGEDDWTPLHLAALNGHLKVVEALLKVDGINVNAKSKNNWTPLHNAAQYGHKDIVDLLLNREAEVNVKIKEQYDAPLHLAAQYGHENVVEVLLEAKNININTEDKDERTALHLAAKNGHEGVVKTLIEYVEKNDLTRLSAFVKDKYDATPLHYAAENGNLEVVGYLVDKRADVNAEAKNNRTPLHSAAQHGREKVVEILIQNGARINVEDGIKKTPLHYAAGNGYEDVVNALLNTKGVENIDVNAKGEDDWTPLHLAALNGHLKVVEALLKVDGINVNAKSKNNWTPLHNAAQYGHKDIVDLLLNREAEVNVKIKEQHDTPLHLAAQYGHENVVEALLNKGAEVNAKTTQGFTPLHSAAQHGRENVVEVLLEAKNININTEDKDERTALHLAAKNGYKGVVKTLIEHVKKNNPNRVNNFVNVQDKYNATPLHYAADNGNANTIEILIENGADINAEANKWTPLHSAANHGNTVAVEILIQNGARVNVEDGIKKTPLHYAAGNGYEDVVKALLKADGINVNAKSEDDCTPLHFAAQNDHLKVVEALLKADGIKVNAQTHKEYAKPLHLAAYNGHNEVVDALLSKDAEVNAKTNTGWTPLHYAAQNGHKEAIDALLNRGADPTVKNSNDETPASLAGKKGNKEIVEILVKYIQSHQKGEVSGLSNKCLPGPSSAKRRKRNAESECLFSWKDIDEFNEEKDEKRDLSKIKVDSEKFVDYIKDLPEEKRTQLIQLADQVQVTGRFQGLVNNLISNQKIMNHLTRVGRISGIAMHGMMGKATLAAFLNGDDKGVAINLGFIAGGQGFARVAQAVSIKGMGLILDGKLLLGRSLKAASPFLARGTSAFVVYDLINQIKEFKNGTEEALVGIVGDGIYLGVDAAEIGIEIAEAFEIFEGVSSITGPIGAAIGAIIFVGTDIYLAVKRVDKINEIIHLTGNERFFEGLRAFIGMQPEQYIEELMEEKQVNNQLVKQGLEYLQQHSDIQRYVFPTGKSVIDSCRDVPYKTSVCVSGGFGGGCSKTRTVTRYTEECTTKFQVDLDNKVLLNRKRTDIKWSRTKPDNQNGGKLFCLPQGDYEQVSSDGAYFCENAIGIESSTNKTENYTFINLGEGNDQVDGFSDSPNIILAGSGLKKLHGGDKNDIFILQGNVEGNIDGGGGTNTVDLGEFASEAESVSVDLNKSRVGNLWIAQINNVLARKDKKDVIYCDVNTQHVDGRGGRDKNAQDIIVIDYSNCLFYHKDPKDCNRYLNGNFTPEIQIAVRPYTIVNNNALRGNFSYIIPTGSGEADVYLFSSEPRHDFFFNYTLLDIKGINASNDGISYNVTFSFTNNGIDGGLFNVTTSSNTNNTFYKLNDNTEIKVGKKNLYAIQGSDRSTDEIVNSYPAIANRLKMSLFVQSLNETVAIGHGNHDVLHNNPYYKSHLIGNGGENIFVVTSGYGTLDDSKLPIPEVVIYDVDKENLIDTLDLRQIKKQIVKDLGKEVKARTSMSGQDLLIELFYPNSTKSLVTVILKNALVTNWHERLQVILNDSPMKIEEFNLKPLPLVFGEDKEIIVIMPKDIEEESKLVISKKAGDCAFARLGNDLIITNAFGRNLTNNELCTISLNNFYQEPKMQTLSIKFADKEILLKDEMDKINNAFTLNEQLARYKNDTYNTIFTNASNITDLHRRKRRDENVVRGYENNNDQELFYAQDNATFTIKNNQVTSGAGRLSSWINDCATWVKDSINGLVGHIDKNDQVFFSAQNNADFTIKNTSETSSWINTVLDNTTKGIYKLIFSSPKVSFSTTNVEHPALSSQQQNNNVTALAQNVDLDGTILLLDVFIRKLIGQKYIAVNQDVSLLEVQADALNITEEFGKILSTTFNTSAEELIDLAEVQSKIFKAMMSGDGGRIPKILYSSVEEAKLEPEVTKKILGALEGFSLANISPSEGQTKHLPSLPNTTYNKPQTCLSSIKVENSSVQLCRAV